MHSDICGLALVAAFAAECLRPMPSGIIEPDTTERSYPSGVQQYSTGTSWSQTLFTRGTAGDRAALGVSPRQPGRRRSIQAKRAFQGDNVADDLEVLQASMVSAISGWSALSIAGRNRDRGGCHLLQSGSQSLCQAKPAVRRCSGWPSAQRPVKRPAANDRQGRWHRHRAISCILCSHYSIFSL